MRGSWTRGTQILILLEERPDLSTKEIAAAIGASVGGTWKLLDRARRRDWLTRRRHTRTQLWLYRLSGDGRIELARVRRRRAETVRRPQNLHARGNPRAVLECVVSWPGMTAQAIANELGLPRRRVLNIAVVLRHRGLLEVGTPYHATPAGQRLVVLPPRRTAC